MPNGRIVNLVFKKFDKKVFYIFFAFYEKHFLCQIVIKPNLSRLEIQKKQKFFLPRLRMFKGGTVSYRNTVRLTFYLNF